MYFFFFGRLCKKNTMWSACLKFISLAPAERAMFNVRFHRAAVGRCYIPLSYHMVCGTAVIGCSRYRHPLSCTFFFCSARTYKLMMYDTRYNKAVCSRNVFAVPPTARSLARSRPALLSQQVYADTTRSSLSERPSNQPTPPAGKHGSCVLCTVAYSQ